MKEGGSGESSLQYQFTQEKLFMRTASRKSRQQSVMNFQMEGSGSPQKDIVVIKKSKTKNKGMKISLQSSSASLQCRTENPKELLWGESEYEDDHICQVNKELDLNRCEKCDSTLRSPFYFKDAEIIKPFSIYYVDYIKTFARKMECHTLPIYKQKDFLLINYLPYMRQWSLFVLDRTPQFGLEELIYPLAPQIQGKSFLKDKCKQIELSKSLPQILSLSYPIMKQKVNERQKTLRVKAIDGVQKPIDSEELENKEQQNTKRSTFDISSISKAKDTFDFDTFTILGNHESSNIAFCTVNQQENKCQILLRSDTNTKGCLHWFMFTIRVNSLSNTELSTFESTNKATNNSDLSFKEGDRSLSSQKKTVTFSILNNQRNGYLFREGMNLAILDSCKAEKGWHRGGESIFYYKSNVDHQFFQQDEENLQKKQLTPQASMKDQMIIHLVQPNTKRGFQTMDFTYTFTEEGQRVTFAYCFPYTLTDLVKFLENQESILLQQDSPCIHKPTTDSNNKKISIKTSNVYYKRKIIASTRLGLPLILLKITSSRKVSFKKKVIFIIARQHPGETPSSFVCQGIISYLLQISPQTQFLLNTYIFKIVPMMNPDGVVTGNSRCNLSGADLNRKWGNPDPILHPEVFEVKKELKSSHEKREVHIFCDLHGHSMKKQSFFYGCNKSSCGGASAWAQTRLLPKILAKKCPFFSLSECRFRVTEDKKNTARVIAWREIKIENSFTLETSFFGFNDTQNEGKPTNFQIPDLEAIGKCLAESYLEYTLAMESLTNELLMCDGQLKSHRFCDSPKKKLSVASAVKIFSKELLPADNQQDFSMGSQLAGQMTNLNFQANTFLNSQQLGNSQSGCNLLRLSSALLQGQSSSTYPSNKGSSHSKSNSPIKDKSSNKSRKIDCNQIQSVANEGVLTQEQVAAFCKGMKGGDWREYFGVNELEKNFKKIAKGEDPNELESGSGSDSEAEVDIFKEGELKMSCNKKRKKRKIKGKKGKKELSQTRSSTVDLAKVIQTPLFTTPLASEKKKIVVQQANGMNSRWNPSPIIQSYKLQLEMKKLQLKKQPYPLAKVGQNQIENSSQNNQVQNQQDSQWINSQQTQPIMQSSQIQQMYSQQTQQTNQWGPTQGNTQAKISSTVMLPCLPVQKNSLNGNYFDKRLQDIGNFLYNSNANNQLLPSGSHTVSITSKVSAVFNQVQNRISQGNNLPFNKRNQLRHQSSLPVSEEKQDLITDSSSKNNQQKRIKWFPQDDSSQIAYDSQNIQIFNNNDFQASSFPSNTLGGSYQINIKTNDQREQNNMNEVITEEALSKKKQLLQIYENATQNLPALQINQEAQDQKFTWQQWQASKIKYCEEEEKDKDNEKVNEEKDNEEEISEEDQEQEEVSQQDNQEDQEQEIASYQGKSEEIQKREWSEDEQEEFEAEDLENDRDNSAEIEEEECGQSIEYQEQIVKTIEGEKEILTEIVDMDEGTQNKDNSLAQEDSNREVEFEDKTNEDENTDTQNQKEYDTQEQIEVIESDDQNNEENQYQVDTQFEENQINQKELTVMSSPTRKKSGQWRKSQNQFNLSKTNPQKEIQTNLINNCQQSSRKSEIDDTKSFIISKDMPNILLQKEEKQIPNEKGKQNFLNSFKKPEIEKPIKTPQKVAVRYYSAQNQKGQVNYYDQNSYKYKQFYANQQQEQDEDHDSKDHSISDQANQYNLGGYNYSGNMNSNNANNNTNNNNNNSNNRPGSYYDQAFIKDKKKNYGFNFDKKYKSKETTNLLQNPSVSRNSQISSIANSFNLQYNFLKFSSDKIGNVLSRGPLAAYQPALKKLRAHSIQDAKLQNRQNLENVTTSSDEYTLQLYLSQESNPGSAMLQQRSKNFSLHGGSTSYLNANRPKKGTVS